MSVESMTEMWLKKSLLLSALDKKFKILIFLGSPFFSFEFVNARM